MRRMQRGGGTAEVAGCPGYKGSRGGGDHWVADAETKRDKMPQPPGRRGTRCRRRRDGGGTTRSASASIQESHGIGGAQFVTQWTRSKRTRSTGATKSTAAEELASVLGEYAKITPPPLMATSWAMTRQYRGLFTRIETE